MNSFYKLIASILKEAEAFSGHASFRVVDNDAVGTDPIRALNLDAVPLDDTNVMVTLSWEGGVKEFEKTMPSEEANHMFQLISTDLSNVVSLTSEQKFEEAKEAMKNILKTYAETTDTPDTPVSTTAPKLNVTQASAEKSVDRLHCPKCGIPTIDDSTEDLTEDEKMCDKCYNDYWENRKAAQDSNLWKQAKITMQNLWFSTPDELLQYQEKMKGKQTTNQDNIPLWDAQKGKNESKDQLAAPSMSYEDVEKDKEKEHQNIEKQIDEKIKTELESAMQEKAASVFGPSDVALVEALRAPGIGRNWDEIKKIFTKDLNRDKESTTIFLDEQRKLSGDTSVEVKVEEENPLAPPSDLVSPETHEKLLKDIEEKKSKPPVEEVKEKEIEKVEPPIVEESAQKGICPECDGEGSVPVVRGGRVIATDCPSCGGDAHIMQHDKSIESSIEEISRADNTDIRKMAKEADTSKCKNCPHGEAAHDTKLTGHCVHEKCPCKNYVKQASLKVKADDTNPLQESIKEEPTMETPSQDVVPMGKQDDHQKPNPGDWVFVKSDLKDELPATKAKFVSDYMSDDGTEWATVETPDQELLEVEMYRVTKITDSKPVVQEADPVSEPDINMQTEAPVNVTPSLEKLTSNLKVDADEASQELAYERAMDRLDSKMMKGLIHQEEYDAEAARLRKEMFPNEAPYKDLLAIKAEAEQLLKEVKSMGKISFKFIKKGLEKHADDSAFEGNGWCRVWIQEDEIASDSRYPEIMKLPDEKVKIDALKDLARNMAHEALRLADSAGAKVGVQSWFDSLDLSDHDRIDWVALATPQVSESSLKVKADEPVVETPKTNLKDLKITPKYVEKEKAVPATPEMDAVLSKMDELEQKLGVLDQAKKEIQARMKAEMSKIDQSGERVQMEQELQSAVEKAGILIEATESKIVSWRDKLLTLQNEEVQMVPQLTPKEMLAKIYKKFEGAESYVTSVLNGMLSLAKNVTVRTLTRWPNKKSSLVKEASELDEMNQINEELLAALKELSTPL